MLMQKVGGITGLASSCGLTEEAKELVNYYVSISEMRFEGRAHDSKLCDEAQNMVLTTDQKIQKMQTKKSAPVIKLYEDNGYYDAITPFANDTYSPNTKNNFCRILGGDSSTDENATSTNE